MNEMDKPGRERVRMKCSNDKVVIESMVSKALAVSRKRM